MQDYQKQLKEEFDGLFSLADEIGAMLWTEIKNCKN